MYSPPRPSPQVLATLLMRPAYVSLLPDCLPAGNPLARPSLASPYTHASRWPGPEQTATVVNLLSGELA